MNDTNAPVVGFLEFARRQITGDLYPRTLWGPMFCAIGASITAFAGGYYETHRPLLGGVLLTFALLAILRWAHRPPGPTADLPHCERWSRNHWWMLAITSVVWCVFLVAVGRIEQRATMPMFVAALVTIAFTTASVESLAIDRWRALFVISLQELPASTLFLWEEAELRALAAVMLAFWVYQALHLWRRAREYQTQLLAVHSLRVSRAEVARLSRTDALTGVANRRAYESSLATLWNHFARSEGTLSLLVLDLDHFKRINDEFGHAAGDACLKSVASLLAARFQRSLETVARIGGEEFAVLLPGITIESALKRAEIVGVELAQLRTEYEGKKISMTVSIGVGAAHWGLDSNPTNFFARVDAACYAAKAQGRNRVVRA